MTANVK